MAGEQGQMKAQYNLGKIYRDGRGVKKDIEEAAKWFMKAALQDYTKAQNHIGTRLILGKGIIQNKVRGMMFLLLAAKQGHKNAAKNIIKYGPSLAPDERSQADRLASKWLPAEQLN